MKSEAYKPQQGLLHRASESPKVAEAQDPGRHKLNKLLTRDAPGPILLHVASQSIYSFMVIAEITQISGVSQPITQPPENGSTSPCCKDSEEGRLLFSHQEGTVITTQPPSTCADLRARSCVTLTSTSKVRGTLAQRVPVRGTTQPSLLKRQ